MATWMTHLRVADWFLNKIAWLVPVEFIGGNIGPDCGESFDNWKTFHPPKEITHWRTLKEPPYINPEEFYNTYLQKEIEHRSFFLGYYIHLVTDLRWHAENARLKSIFNIVKGSSEHAIRFKEEWDLDYLFLRDNPAFRAYQILSQIKEYPNPGLPYFSDSSILSRIQFIAKLYQKKVENLDREFLYVTQQDMNSFIDETCATVHSLLAEKKEL